MIAIASPSQAESALGASGHSGLREQLVQERVLAYFGRQVSFEDDRRRLLDILLAAHFLDVLQVLLAALVREPDDLEQVVSLHHAVGVVVDRLAGAGEQPGGGVVFAQDQVGVGFAALKRDPHGHLAERGLGQRVLAAQGLRAEDHVHAEGTALPHQAVEQQRDFLRDLVVFDEELLELVDDEQDPRHRYLGPGLAIAVQVLTAELAVDLAALLELDVQPLEHAQAELALALDGDHPRMRQLHRRVDLEFDAFLEVDQVELELVGAVAQRSVGDQRVQHRRLARARLAGGEHVLRRALAELQVLQLGGAGAAQRNVDALAAVEGPVLVGLGRDELERNLDAVGVAGGIADLVQDLGEPCPHRAGASSASG